MHIKVKPPGWGFYLPLVKKHSMKKTISLLFSLFFLLQFGCNQPETTQEETFELNDRIRYLEQNLYSELGDFNSRYAEELITLYTRYANEMPEDSLAPDQLLKAADISIFLNQNQRALRLLDRITTSYPDFEKASMAAFLKAYIYDNQIGDTAMARQFYEGFIENYPEHSFVEEAKTAIKNLGKSPEDLIREFEQSGN